MSLADVSTARLVLDAQRLDTRTTHAPRDINVKISHIKFKESILNKERLKRSYQASDFLPDIEISPSRSDLMKNKVKKVDKSIMFSDIQKQRPSADDFFGDIPQCSNQTDVSLTSASDLETNVKSIGKIKKNIIRLPVD